MKKLPLASMANNLVLIKILKQLTGKTELSVKS